MIEQVGRLEAAGIGFRSLTENIDTTTAGGRLIFHVFGALAEFETAQRLRSEGKSLPQIAKVLGVGASSVNRALQGAATTRADLVFPTPPRAPR